MARFSAKTLTPAELGEIVITGCSSGIGRALALEFHARGYRVFATARKPESLADLGSRGIRIGALDVTSQSSIEALDLSNAGMLINNAGFGVMGAMLDVPLEQMRRQFETNVIGLLALIQRVAPAMIARGDGRIVNVSSVSGVLATAFAGAYCSSKAAVNLMSDALRIELRPFGVKVITVQPGAIRSAFGENASATIDAAATGAGHYAALTAAIAQRAVAQQKRAIPAERFASELIDGLTARHPESLIRIGPYSKLFPNLRRFVPERTRDQLLSRLARLDRIGRATRSH